MICRHSIRNKKIDCWGNVLRVVAHSSCKIIIVDLLDCGWRIRGDSGLVDKINSIIHKFWAGIGPKPLMRSVILVHELRDIDLSINCSAKISLIKIFICISYLIKDKIRTCFHFDPAATPKSKRPLLRIVPDKGWPRSSMRRF